MANATQMAKTLPRGNAVLGSVRVRGGTFAGAEPTQSAPVCGRTRKYSVADLRTARSATINGRIKDETAREVVTTGLGTVKVDDMPFVNREEEFWRVFEINAANCRLLRTLECSMITSSHLRMCFLLFCIQYVGGGKTTLGLKFGEKLKDGVLDVRARQCKELATEWALVKLKGVHTVYCNVGGESDIVGETLRILFNSKSVTYSSHRNAADQVVDAAVKLDQPLFIHFDEVGPRTRHDLESLHSFVNEIWTEMWNVKRKGGDMPLIFFLVTGKSIEYFKTGGPTKRSLSPIATKLLVLNMLEPTHVGEIREHLQKCKQPLVLNGVTDDLIPYLDKSLCAVTGGAPRLLLYTLRALHYLCVYEAISLDSIAAIDDAINVRAFELLNGNANVHSELVPTRSSDQQQKDASDETALLLTLCLTKFPLQYETKLKLPNGEIDVGRVLKSHAFFLAHLKNHGPETFVLALPLYHLRALEGSLVGGVPLLLWGMAAAAFHMVDPWRIFEILPAHAVALRACLWNPDEQATWATVIPQWYGASPLAKRMLFKLGSKPVQTNKIDMPATLEDQSLLNKQCKVGGFCIGADKASACDGAYFTRLADDGTAAVLQLQAKLWKDGFQPADLGKELSKVHCPECVPVVLCIVAAKLGPGLNSCVVAQSSRVLILTSWSEAVAAVFTLHRTDLLWHPLGKENWYIWPCKDEKSLFTRSVPARSTRFVVRPKLEIVIPHPDIIREVVGPSDYDLLISAQQKRNMNSIDVIVTTLASVLAAEQPRPAMEPPDKFRDLADEVTLAEAVRMLAEERKFTNQERNDDVAFLHKNRIRTVGDLRVLEPSDIKDLGFAPVITRYLLRVHSGRR